MYKPKSQKERVAHRYKISLGQLKKILQMVEGGAYCIDVIHQSQAVQKALKETDQVLLGHHLATCVANSIRKGKVKEATAEVLSVFKKQS